MHVCRSGLLLLVAACFGTHGDPVTVASLPPAPPPPLPCIRPAEDAPAAIRAAAVDGTRISFCVGEAADQCFAFDVAAGKLDTRPAPPVPAASTAARIS